jgi:cytoskeletal protein RodZ
VTAGHPAVDNVEDGVSVDNDRRMAGTFLWLIGISLPIAGAILYFATAGRGRAERQPAPPPASTTAPGADAKPAGETPLPPASLDPTAAAPPAAADPTPPAATATEPPATAGSAPPETASTPPTDAAAAPAGDRLTVTMSVKRPCWVSASVDGQQRIERLLQPGEQQTLEVKREMVLTAGDASAVALAFNGASARPLGKTGEVVTARFNLNNYKDYVLQSR